MANGSRHALRVVREVVRGETPANPAMRRIRHTGSTLGLSKEVLQSEELRDDRQIADVRHGARQVAGDINFELSMGSFDLDFEAVFMGAWELDFDGAGSDRLKTGIIRYFHTMEREFGDLESGNRFHRFTGCEYNTLELTINANAMITGTFGVIGKDLGSFAAAPVGATYPAVTTSAPLDSFTGELLEGGAPIAVVTEMSLSINNGLEARFVVGSKTSIKPSVARSNVTGSITAFFESAALLDKFINEAYSALEVNLVDLNGDAYKIVVPRLKYTGGQPDVEGEGPITLTMPFQATLDSVTGTNLILIKDPAGSI